LQRWYRTFPHGLPGIGLLVLRIAVGAKLLIQASALVLDPQAQKLGVWLLVPLVVGMAASFMLGFLTQLVAGLSALAGVAIYLWHPAWASSFLSFLSFDTVGVALAMALLGPGAISLDAYFFGRRKIVIPRVARS
jgi:Trk-type K+ transport system membrane component